MDDDTRAELDDLRSTLAVEEAALAEVVADNAALIARDVDDDQPSPSRNEKKAMRARVVAAEAAVHEVRERIRKIEWADVGITEGEPQVLGVDNLAQFQAAAEQGGTA